MDEKKFNPEKLAKLNNPRRLLDIPPAVIWEKLELEHGETLVDIGAGTGFFSIPFVTYVPHGKVYACDISDSMLQWLRENVAPQHPNIIPVKMFEAKVPLEDGCADLVYMINLHHELYEPLNLLIESRRLLKKTGKICIIDWKKEPMAEGPPTDIRYRPEIVSQQLNKAGFQQIRHFDELQKHFLIIARPCS